MVLKIIVVSTLISIVQCTSYWQPLYRFPAKPYAQAPAAGSKCTCGQLPGLSHRIVSGWETVGPEHPFLAMLLKNGRLNCGGTVINSLYVLTAAHCIKPNVPKSSVTVLLGIHDRRDIGSATQDHTYSVAKRLVHPHYGKHPRGGTDNDIGLIRLDRPIVFNNFVQPICLPSLADTAGVRSAWVQGWGLDAMDGNTTNIPMETKLDILTTAECKKTPSKAILGSPDLHICAIHANTDSCQGDSGGPLFFHRGSHTIQLGLVSEGIGCAVPGYPGIYTRVDKFLPWIYSNTADATSCTM